ncbi:MAG TPA: metallophosphoesterase [Acidobacteriaceae bacterium]
MPRWTLPFGLAITLAAFSLLSAQTSAPTKNATPRSATHTNAKLQPAVNVVMLSDLHFDPYRDPAKFQVLRTAPVEQWEQILGSPASATQANDFASLQKACGARAPDSSWSVIASSLHAAHAQQPKPLFVTVSGDLLTHQFDCRLHTLLPSGTAKDLSDFASKTVTFLAMQLHNAFPGVPVYIALGNNDSGCKDYEDDPGSDFLRNTAKSFSADLPEGPNRDALLQQFVDEGDYNVALPAPMSKTRLIVVQNLFESKWYKTCSETGDTTKAAATQLTWLRAQLDDARKHGQHAWVMAHIPPGIDVYANFHKMILQPDHLCDVTAPTSFLSTDALADILTDYADVVRLAIFGHTHMDEIKLLRNKSGGIVPAKLVPAISPVNGNNPAFLVARVDPSSSWLKDYGVFVAHMPDLSTWSETYRYSRAYGQPDFSATSVKRLTSKLVADRTGDSELARTYAKRFYPGDSGLYALGLHQLWPAYSCSMVETSGAAVHACMCPAHAAGK